MSNNIKETYHVVSTNFDESIVITFDLVVDLSESELHELNNFWAFAEDRLSAAEGDIKQVVCHLHAAQLRYGFIHDSVHDDRTANEYLSEQEGFYLTPKVVIQDFNGEFDDSTETKYKIAETQDDQ